MCFLLDKVKLPESQTSRHVLSKNRNQQDHNIQYSYITMQGLPTSLESQNAPLVLKSTKRP